MLRGRAFSLAVAGLLAFCSNAHAAGCTGEKMKTLDSGFVHKVVAGSDKIEAVKEPGGKDASFTLELLAPYFVICEYDQFYKITDLPAESVAEAETGKVGYVLRDQVFNWPTREALNFGNVFMERRPEIVAWDDEEVLKKFLETGVERLAPPAFRENIESTLKRERSTRPYPVLDSKIMMMRGKERRVYHVLLPAALPPEAKIVIPTDPAEKKAVVDKMDKAMTSATFVLAFDATGSMESFAREMAKSIKTAFEALPSHIQNGSRVGFVFFRDEDDKEKIVEVKPQPVADAMRALQDAATKEYMTGGGDAAEPVLDAVYVAGHLYPWSAGSQGKKIIIAVLSDDAKPATTGKIDTRVPPGLEPAQIASNLRSEGIIVIAVQAGPNTGPNLVSVMTTIAEGTAGTFIEWGKGGEELASRVTNAVAAQLTTTATKTYDEGKGILAKVEFDYRGYATIPLAVLDGEKMRRLRESGLRFNVDPGKGGILIREGYILENNDLLEPQIQINKKTLDSLINLFSALGVAGVDASAMRETAGRALAAIGGESYNPSESIEVTIKKRLGIQFRTKLLDFNLEYLAGLNKSERLELTKRIQDRGSILSQFLEANLTTLDREPSVWMPVDKLP